jgi:hypothetical protein
VIFSNEVCSNFTAKSSRTLLSKFVYSISVILCSFTNGTKERSEARNFGIDDNIVAFVYIISYLPIMHD